MANCECLEQIEQIDSELTAINYLDSDLNKVAQINSTLVSITPINANNIYSADIQESDWVLEDDGYYYYTIRESSHNFKNPTIMTFVVSSNGYMENCIFSYSVLSNGDIRIRLSFPVFAKIKIEGEL